MYNYAEKFLYHIIKQELQRKDSYLQIYGVLIERSYILPHFTYPFELMNQKGLVFNYLIVFTSGIIIFHTLLKT